MKHKLSQYNKPDLSSNLHSESSKNDSYRWEISKNIFATRSADLRWERVCFIGIVYCSENVFHILLLCDSRVFLIRNFWANERPTTTENETETENPNYPKSQTKAIVRGGLYYKTEVKWRRFITCMICMKTLL